VAEGGKRGPGTSHCKTLEPKVSFKSLWQRLSYSKFVSVLVTLFACVTKEPSSKIKSPLSRFSQMSIT
jgi:hypothetical protein